jgi:sec-independent protein translocase protein TatA
MPALGPTELLVLLFIVLLVFGAKRLPELGRSLGSGMREFKDSVTGAESKRLPSARGAAASKEHPERITTAAAEERGG